MIRIFIGYDRREAIGFQVLRHSIISRASEPVSITPIVLQNLGGLYQRMEDPLQSTEFSFSRFFAPYLADYAGWASFWTAIVSARTTSRNYGCSGIADMQCSASSMTTTQQTPPSFGVPSKPNKRKRTGPALC
jgi:hypothetical protein